MGEIINISNIISPELKKKFEEEYKDYKVAITTDTYRDGIIRVFLRRSDRQQKSFFYNLEEDKYASNVVDCVAPTLLPIGNCYTLHGYKIGTDIRPFLAITNIDNGVVLPIGYDIYNKRLIELPISNDGLIDDEEMIKILSKEIPCNGYLEYDYNDSLFYANIYIILEKLGAENFNTCDKLAEVNNDKIQELLAKTLARIAKKYSGRMK